MFEELRKQASEIMEWIPDSDNEAQNAEKQAIIKLQAKIKTM